MRFWENSGSRGDAHARRNAFFATDGNQMPFDFAQGHEPVEWHTDEMREICFALIELPVFINHSARSGF
jgi:hypothetical protein